jgi:hypothetical protein
MIEMPVGERLLRPIVGMNAAGADGFGSLNYISEQMLKNFLTIVGVAPFVTPACVSKRPPI